MENANVEAIKKEISLHRSLLKSLHRQKESCEKELATTELSAERKHELQNELNELRAVTFVVQNNSWDLTTRILRIYGRRQGHNIRSWRKDKRKFLEEAIEQEVKSCIDRNDAYTAHLLLTALLQQDAHRNSPDPQFDKRFRKKLERQKLEVGELLKKTHGLKSAPDWGEHIDWLSQD